MQGAENRISNRHVSLMTCLMGLMVLHSTGSSYADAVRLNSPAGTNSALRLSTASIHTTIFRATRFTGRYDGKTFSPPNSQLFFLLECGLLECQPDWRVVTILEIGPLDHHH